MTREILQALRNIEDKIMREPTAFNWTPSMDAIWPKDMRPTMSGLLAIWEAMREAAVYGEADTSTSPKPLADDGWIRWDGGEKPDLPMDTMVDVKFRDGDVVNSFHVGTWFGPPFSNNWLHDGSKADIIAYRVVSP